MQDKQSQTGMTFPELVSELIGIRFWQLFVRLIAVFALVIPFLLILKALIPNLSIFSNPVQSEPWEYNVLVSANRLWLDTGITVKEDEKIEIRVTGAVHLAAHHLVWNSMADVVPKINWYFYPRLKEQRSKATKEDKKRYPGMIDEGEEPGTLLMHIGNETIGPDASSSSSKPDSLYSISPQDNANKAWELNLHRKGAIYLIVNDGIATDSLYAPPASTADFDRLKELQKIRDRFVDSNSPSLPLIGTDIRPLTHYYGLYAGKIPKDTTELADLREKRWNSLPKEYRGRLWFDDNIGAYLVNIRLPDRKK